MSQRERNIPQFLSDIPQQKMQIACGGIENGRHAHCLFLIGQSTETGALMMEKEYYYETEVGWMGKRHGYLQSEGLPILEISSPPEFQGQEHTWTPEHLFVASINSCFMATFVAMAEYSKLELISFTSSAKGKLEKVERGYIVTEVTLKPKLIIKHEYDTERAERLLEKAEKACFISNSIKATVKLAPEIQFDEICACA